MKKFASTEPLWIEEATFETKLSELRSKLHRIPETALHEYQTTELLRMELRKLPLEVVELGLKTGVAALLRGGHAGPTVALRGDIDALPIQEETGAEDASVHSGVMHACGHDIHATALLGVAMLLAQQKEHLNGNILFLFQPAEELGDGAESVIGTGIFERIPITAMFGFHVWPQLPLGQVGLRTGVLMSAKDCFQITICGQGGHGSTPQFSRDPIPAGAALVVDLQTIVSRNIASQEQVVVSVCSIQAGNSDNVIPDKCVLLGSIRTFSAETRNTVLIRMKEMSNGIAAAYGCTAECIFTSYTPAVVNNPQLVRMMGACVEELFGSQACQEPEPIMISEDFACYGAEFPTCFALLGVGTKEGQNPPLHSPHFYVDKRALVLAAKLLAHTVCRFLEQPAKLGKCGSIGGGFYG